MRTSCAADAGPPSISSTNSATSRAGTGASTDTAQISTSTMAARLTWEAMSTYLYGMRSATGPSTLRPKIDGTRLTASVVAVARGDCVRS